MRIGIGQYVILRPLSTLISVISQAMGDYCLSSWSPKFLHLCAHEPSRFMSGR